MKGGVLVIQGGGHQTDGREGYFHKFPYIMTLEKSRKLKDALHYIH